MNYKFPKNKKLAKNRQFKAVLDRNICIGDRLMTLFMAENDCGYPRLGVSVGKFCGNAIVRNRLKRLLREAFRQNQDQIPADFDYLLMISRRWPKKLDSTAERKAAAAKLTFEQVQNSLLMLVEKAVAKISREQKEK